MFTLDEELLHIEQAGLYRKLRIMHSPSGPRVVIDGREMVMLASNDYLGLCSHPRMIRRSQDALNAWGTGSGAARLICGNHALFPELEKKIAAFKQTEDALVFSTGYMANTGLLAALAGSQDAIYSDELNHASIIDGCRLSRASVEIYPHRDIAVLESMLIHGSGFRRRIIVSDGVFSMNGDIAPVPDLLGLARRYDAFLIIDDAHGTGVTGQSGRGTLEHFGLCGSPDIITVGTLGKALGCFGAFIAGSRQLKALLINRCRSFMFTTALPASLAASALEALEIIEDEPERRLQLAQNSAFMRSGLRSLGFNTLASETQIMPVIIGPPGEAVAISKHLFDKDIFIQAIRPPTVPEGSARLRITVTATHTQADLEIALDALKEAGKRFGVL